ncbi:MAG: hypothetical protein M1837_002254 [Sclerophora amabilis]|nr:MAG: hypothetical protein M1837_002254 [Sclerophora amabilis]
MSTAYSTPRVTGQLPDGIDSRGRPYYLEPRDRSASSSTSSAYRSATSGGASSYYSAPDPWPPKGGGRLDPRFGRDLATQEKIGENSGLAPPYGSYPPRSTVLDPQTQRHFERTTRGYNPNVHGDFPDNASTSSEPRYDEIGYVREKGGWPRHSTMDNAYRDYKDATHRHQVALKSYQNISPRLAAQSEERDGRVYGPVLGGMYYPEHHATLAGYADAAAEGGFQ